MGKNVEKIIGVGRLGCAVAEEFLSYPEYRIYKILSESPEREDLSVGLCDNMEEYEKSVDFDEVGIYLRSVKSSDNVLLVIEGGDPISGIVLRTLEKVKDAEISVLYICPDRQMISETQRRDDKICYSVLQEYARSGVFKQLMLARKPTIEALIGDVPIDQYEKTFSYFVSYAVAMMNYFANTDTLLENQINPADVCRIVTLALSSLDDSDSPLNSLFPLEEVRDLHFFYGIPTSDLSEDASLLKKIKSHAKKHKTDKNVVSYSVHETSLEDVMVLCKAYSSTVQKLG
jgi:hypothetical protein